MENSPDTLLNADQSEFGEQKSKKVKLKLIFWLSLSLILLIFITFFALTRGDVNQANSAPLIAPTASVSTTNKTTPTSSPTGIGEQTMQSLVTLKFVDYPSFKVFFPESWESKTSGTLSTQMEYTFTKNESQLIFTQIQGDSEECVLDSKRIDPNNSVFFIDLSKYNYDTIETSIGKFYIFRTNSDSKEYSFCGPRIGIDNRYFRVSSFGRVSFINNNDGNETLLTEAKEIMKGIVLVKE